MTVQTVPAYLQNASHSAAVFRQAVSAAFQSPGILGAGELAVTQQGTPNMSIILGAGRAMVAGSQVTPPAGLSFTTQAMYNTLNDGAITLTVTTANATNPRIDAVYIGVQDAYYSGSNNQAVAGIVTGTPASSPVAPSIPANALLLAYIAVGAGVTSIVTANITINAASASLIGLPTYGAFTPQGIYAAGSPKPQVVAQNGRRYLEGTVTSSSATFVTNTIYQVGTIPASFAPSSTRTFLVYAGSGATNSVAYMTVNSSGTMIMVIITSGFSGTLLLSLDGPSWR